MYIALISLPASSPAEPFIAGRSVAHRQLDFAVAAGCERVVVLGDGGSGEAIALRHAAEAAGCRFQAVPDARGLAPLAAAGAHLLVVAPGLLPEADEALERLREGPVVLVLPAPTGVAARFERIDLDRAWAGAALIPATLIERLNGLAHDIEPASALMRAALQARVPEYILPERALNEGRWTVPAAGHFEAAEEAWLTRHWPALRDVPAPLARFALQLARRGVAVAGTVPVLGLAAAITLALALGAAWLGYAAAGFALVAFASLATSGAAHVARLRRAPFGNGAFRARSALCRLADVALLACACAALEGSWAQRLFTGLVMLASLRLESDYWASHWLRHPVLLAIVLAVAAAFGMAEPVIMLGALGAMALHFAWRARKARITAD